MSNEIIEKSKEVKHGEEFVEAMLKLSPEELCALSRFLGVRLLTDEVDPETKKAKPREGADIISDCIDHYAQLARPDRRFLLSYLKKNGGKKINGLNSNNSKKK